MEFTLFLFGKERKIKHDKGDCKKVDHFKQWDFRQQINFQFVCRQKTCMTDFKVIFEILKTKIFDSTLDFYFCDSI